MNLNLGTAGFTALMKDAVVAFLGAGIVVGLTKFGGVDFGDNAVWAVAGSAVVVGYLRKVFFSQV